jgi:hypothetical protein
MLQGEALRRRGERSSPLQVCFDFATSLFGLGSARFSRVGDRGLFYKDCFGETPKPTRETHALPGTGKDAQSLSNEL